MLGRGQEAQAEDGQKQRCSQIFPRRDSERGPNREELEEGEGGSRTYSRLVTEVSATELRLGIEGRVSPVEDNTWPPCQGQHQDQVAIRWRVAQTVRG